MAAQAHWTSSVLSQEAPLRSRDDLRLPALSFWPGDRPAQETRCPSLANRLISAPVSARIEVAAKLAMPGMASKSAVKSRKKPRPAAASSSILAIWRRRAGRYLAAYEYRFKPPFRSSEHGSGAGESRCSNRAETLCAP